MLPLLSLVTVCCANNGRGCDKTVPAQIMGGLAANKPILPLITGPMMPGSNRGKRLGACTDCRNNWAAFRAGVIDVEEISAINEELAPTVCMTI
jgi:dihydroxy-acid dehydratase